MGALDPDVSTWVWLTLAAGATGVAVAVRRWRLPAAAVALGALVGWLTGLSGGTVAVQALLAGGVAVVVGATAARYLALVRQGSGLPPGTGGSRLVGTTGTITHHDEAGITRVRVLGDEWPVAGGAPGLSEGDHVRVTAVEGVALVVTPATASTDPTVDPAPDDASHPQPQDGVT